MHRAIVRAAMRMHNVELAATFGRVDGEEYGYYIFIFEQEDCGFIAELNEQNGSITEFSDLDECDNMLCYFLATTERSNHTLREEIFEARNIIRYWLE